MMRRTLRSAWRLLGVLALILGGLVVLRALFPHWQPAQRARVKQRWSRALVATLGVRIEASGPAPAPGTLLVGNHVSWLDVFVLNALAPTSFVCKSEVRGWPLIGALVSRSGTLFITRGSRAAAARAVQSIARRLAAGERVAIFPEGTTSSGDRLLPFRGALFEAAIAAGAPVQPFALRYLDALGQPSTAPAYDGDVSFLQSLLAIVRSEGLCARPVYLAPASGVPDRRALCRRAEHEVSTALGFAPAIAAAA
ncbi:MAG: lysophospholipid acyltransferase family protein [Candidatus Dactylopiibacterium sp.]|nr:lysophospholipid acyltransferase family protein [Candidatus Dactylopiibacterium sp.]